MGVSINPIYASNHKFTDPIRLFKANDPYYFAVDNIPIAQLQENCRWLKDQIMNLDLAIDGVSRKAFDELKPSFGGTDRSLKVKPGRLIARVNDAYNVSALDFLTIQSDAKVWLGEELKYKRTPEQLTKQINAINNLFAGDTVYNLNGLEFHIAAWKHNLDTPESDVEIVYDPDNYPRYPDVFLWALLDTFNIVRGGMPPTYPESSPDALFILTNNFIRKWRGVARTAVVDVASELTIEIPEYDNADFFVYENGVKTLLNGTQRVDLVFLYTKPIDSESTHIQEGDSIKTITIPELGIIKGAGIGFSKGQEGNNTVEFNTVNTGNIEKGTSLDLVSKDRRIMSTLADASSNSNNGFLLGPYSTKAVHGSFPSPDDLMNLAPLLLADLETDDPRLIGQTAFPICYIVVSKPSSTSQTNTFGQNILTDSDLIDIRPFFRTAELTYNERAGIAAAVPQLSLANPAIGEMQHRHDLRKLRENIIEQLPSESMESNGKAIAKGIVFGGLLYGPEGAILQLNNYAWANVSSTGGILHPDLLTILGFATNSDMKIPLFPTWDFAQWSKGLNDRGSSINDWIDTRKIWPTEALANGDPVGKLFNAIGYGLDPAVRSDLGLDSFQDNAGKVKGSPGAHDYAPTFIRSCKKRIHITSIPEWVKDIQIHASYLNCIPEVSEGAQYSHNAAASYAGISVSKGKIWNEGEAAEDNISYPSRHCVVTITVYWSGKGGMSQDNSEQFPHFSRNGLTFGSFAVSRGDQYDNTNQFKFGKAIYPTVEFTVMGFTIKECTPNYTGYGLTQNAAPNEYMHLTDAQRVTLLDGVYRPAFNSIQAKD